MKYKNIIFDWNRTLYSPATNDLLPNAKKLLTKLRQENVPLLLVSYDSHNTKAAIDKLKIGDFFEKIILVKDEKTVRDFAPHIAQKNPKLTLIIGDRLNGEIKIGNVLGATTIWLQEKTLATDENDLQKIKADYIANDLSEVEKLILTN